jgi:hypothetical protein
MLCPVAITLSVLSCQIHGNPMVQILKAIQDHSVAVQEISKFNFKHGYKQLFQSIHQELSSIALKYGKKTFQDYCNQVSPEDKDKCIASAEIEDIKRILTWYYAIMLPGSKEMGFSDANKVNKMILLMEACKAHSGPTYNVIPDVNSKLCITTTIIMAYTWSYLIGKTIYPYDTFLTLSIHAQFISRFLCLALELLASEYQI